MENFQNDWERLVKGSSVDQENSEKTSVSIQLVNLIVSSIGNQAKSNKITKYLPTYFLPKKFCDLWMQKHAGKIAFIGPRTQTTKRQRARKGRKIIL